MDSKRDGKEEVPVIRNFLITAGREFYKKSPSSSLTTASPPRVCMPPCRGCGGDRGRRCNRGNRGNARSHRGITLLIATHTTMRQCSRAAAFYFYCNGIASALFDNDHSVSNRISRCSLGEAEVVYPILY